MNRIDASIHDTIDKENLCQLDKVLTSFIRSTSAQMEVAPQVFSTALWESLSLCLFYQQKDSEANEELATWMINKLARQFSFSKVISN